MILKGLRSLRLLILLAALSTSVAASAQSGPPEPAPPVVTRVNDRPISFLDVPAPRRFVTQHETVIRGVPLRYSATAGETYIANLYGEPIARFFSFAYVKDGLRDPRRPVLFVFNGGPGSASIWLHMGVIGPRRLVLDQEVNPSPVPPFGIQNNPYSPLDVADLVFIDPVGTGFSQAVGNARNSDFFGVDEDADSVARFVEMWLTENGRWNSPKYLMGESYGSLRAAVLPRALMGGPFYGGVMRGITVDGVILLGVALDIQRLTAQAQPAPGPDPQAGLSLPAMAATAWYHNRIDRAGRSIEQLHAEVSQFAKLEYPKAAFQASTNSLPGREKSRLAQQLASYTGISAATWSQNDLRLPTTQFLKMILRDAGLQAGAYDSRYTLPLTPTANDPVADDPAMARYVPGFVAAFHEMITNELDVRMPMPYNSITWADLNFKWNWKRIGGAAGQPPIADLAVAMRRNPQMNVLFASGYYDMVTTAASAEFQARKAGLPPDRLTIRNYESGHMLYLGDTAEQFANDVRRLIASRLAAAPTRRASTFDGQ